ncbi:hypothetical protein BC332_15116 [Capsicum chinense]|nr:hypothetical protein BC332_15116 [Capsicum chinense]
MMASPRSQSIEDRDEAENSTEAAGRLDDKKYFIDCNDAGADFIVVAQGHGYNFSEYVETPKMEKLRDFLPKVEKDDDDDDDDDVLLAAQVNLFDTRPRRGLENWMKKEKVLTKRRFVFYKEKLDALKKSASSGSQEKDPTRVEALSTFIWEETWKLNKDSNKKMFVHAVN